MAGNIALMNCTKQGAAKIKESPRRIKDGIAAAEELRIQVVGVWVTMGQYDLVVVMDAPDDAVVGTFVFSLGRLGSVTTQTMRAFCEQEPVESAGRLP